MTSATCFHIRVILGQTPEATDRGVAGVVLISLVVDPFDAVVQGFHGSSEIDEICGDTNTNPWYESAIPPTPVLSNF